MKYLSSIGLSVKDETVLKSLVDLLGARTSEEWLYRDNAPVDALLLDIDNPDAVARWRTEPETIKRNTIAYSSAETGLSIEHRISKPLRAADLIAVLKDIESQVSTDQGRANSKAAPVAAVSTLAECMARHAQGQLKLASGDHEVLLDRDNQRYCSTEHGDALVALLTHPFSGYRVSKGPDVQLSSGTSPKWQDQRPLLWLVGLFGSHGKLIEAIDRSGRFKITRWPGFGAVRPSHKILSLCALLTRKAGMTIEEIRSATGIAEFDIVSFINACFLTGVLVVDQGDAVVPAASFTPEVPAEKKGLLAKIRSRLAHPRT